VAGEYESALTGKTLRSSSWEGATTQEVSPAMSAVLLLIILALLLGGVGLAVEALRWLLVIALVLFVFSFFTGYRGRSTI
jgi:hypothetical protein